MKWLLTWRYGGRIGLWCQQHWAALLQLDVGDKEVCGEKNGAVLALGRFLRLPEVFSEIIFSVIEIQIQVEKTVLLTQVVGAVSLPRGGGEKERKV